MPEITDTQFREYGQFSALGMTPEEIGKKLKALETVKSEAAERRQAAKDLETKLAAAEAKVPEGAKVLTGDDAKALEVVEASGGLKEVDKRLKRLDELEKKDAARTREDGIRAAAKTEGFDPDAAFKALSRDAEFIGLPFEVREEQREYDAGGGKKEKRAASVGYVTVDGKAVALGEWVQKNAEHILPALKAGTNGGTQQQGREFVEQRGRSAPEGKGGVFDRIREQAKKDHGGNAEGSPSPEEVLARRLGGTPLG